VLLVADSLTVARTPFENVKGAAVYLDEHAGTNGEVALADHSLTAAIDYYIRANGDLKIWPEAPRQLYLDRLDLREDTQTFQRAPDNVWLVYDGSLATPTGFIRTLLREGFSRVGARQFNTGVLIQVEHFRRSI
jgi:hypothetical protein